MRFPCAVALVAILYGGAALADTNGGGDIGEACVADFKRADLDAALVDCKRNPDSGPLSDQRFAELFVGRGMLYEDHRAFDKALHDFTQALKLKPDDAEALHQRGNIYDNLGETEKALQDYDAAIRLDPKNAHTFEDRCVTRSKKGNAADALADCDQATALDPHYGSAAKGRILFAKGQLEEAADSFRAAVKANSTQPYEVIWLYLLTRRSGGDGVPALKEQAKALRLDEWPGPLIRYYLGDASRDEALAAAANPDPVRANEQSCEAAFYLGEDDLIAGRKDDAHRRFQQAVEICPIYFIEDDAAKVELGR